GREKKEKEEVKEKGEKEEEEEENNIETEEEEEKEEEEDKYEIEEGGGEDGGVTGRSASWPTKHVVPLEGECQRCKRGEMPRWGMMEEGMIP
ncbi:hypothetical protein SK128_010466, partial [Halocaridina rubra]